MSNPSMASPICAHHMPRFVVIGNSGCDGQEAIAAALLDPLGHPGSLRRERHQAAPAVGRWDALKGVPGINHPLAQPGDVALVYAEGACQVRLKCVEPVRRATEQQHHGVRVRWRHRKTAWRLLGHQQAEAAYELLHVRPQVLDVSMRGRVGRIRLARVHAEEHVSI